MPIRFLQTLPHIGQFILLIQYKKHTLQYLKLYLFWFTIFLFIEQYNCGDNIHGANKHYNIWATIIIFIGQ